MRSEVAQSTALGQSLPEIEEVEELNVEGSKEIGAVPLFDFSTLDFSTSSQASRTARIRKGSTMSRLGKKTGVPPLPSAGATYRCY
jgi:hypothetical protein